MCISKFSEVVPCNLFFFFSTSNLSLGSVGVPEW